mmetsp:Transcript_2341/g.3389  ORF Transcript_2341/g.3389 Transcript_2341/m.3389 type:complete len:231 (+) Transcript_2341:11368-12060(+)
MHANLLILTRTASWWVCLLIPFMDANLATTLLSTALKSLGDLSLSLALALASANCLALTWTFTHSTLTRALYSVSLCTMVLLCGFECAMLPVNLMLHGLTMMCGVITKNALSNFPRTLWCQLIQPITMCLLIALVTNGKRTLNTRFLFLLDRPTAKVSLRSLRSLIAQYCSMMTNWLTKTHLFGDTPIFLVRILRQSSCTMVSWIISAPNLPINVLLLCVFGLVSKLFTL